MGFEKFTGRNSHEDMWVKVNSHGHLEMSKAVEERWFSDVDRVLFMGDRETNHVVMLPEPASADESDLRKISHSNGEYPYTASGVFLNGFGITAQSIEDPFTLDVKESGQYDAPMFDITPVVEKHGPTDAIEEPV